MGQGMPGGGAPAGSNSGVTTSGSTAAGAVGTGVRAPRIINDPNVGGGPSAEPGGASSAMHGRRIIIQTLHPASGTTCIIPPQELSHLVGGEKVGNCCGGTGSGARAGDVVTITLLNDPRNCQL